VEVLYEIPHQLILTFLTAIFSPSRFSDPEPEAIGAKMFDNRRIVCHRTTLISEMKLLVSAFLMTALLFISERFADAMRSCYGLI